MAPTVARPAWRLGLVLAALPLLALALGERTGRAGWRPPPAGAAAVTVYVTYNGFHSDLIVPQAALQADGAGGPTVAAAGRLSPAPYLAIGWGDMRFYRGRGGGLDRVRDLLRAAVWPGNLPTVHLQRSGDPERQAGDWRTLRLRLSPTDFAAVVRRIDADFVLQDGRPLAAADAVGPQEIYFAGRGAFSVANDCNHWIGAAVGAAGAPHNRLLDTMSWGMSLDLRLRAGAVELPQGRSAARPTRAASRSAASHAASNT